MTKKEIDKVVEGSDTDTVKKRKEALDILKKSYGTDGASSEALEKENRFFDSPPEVRWMSGRNSEWETENACRHRQSKT